MEAALPPAREEVSLTQTSTEPAGPSNPAQQNQLLCCKSIDKLIADADAPGHRLEKKLGPWSLTALGIGAIIGSGIFVLTGTAAAGEHFEAPSILHAQVLDLFVNFLRTGSTAGALMHGRPAAGPSIAISFLLVAVACSFAGLCYAELASMIPIAGSAYTYSYATLGEIFAWIIGWDLILEYVVSNVAVAVGFSGYSKAQLAAFGINLPEKWASPVFAGGHWTGAYFNLPGFLIVFILTLLLVRGVRESAEANNVMVLIKLGAILTFLVVGGMLVKPANWTPFAPSGFAGIVTGGAIVFFTYIGFDSVSTAAEECRTPQRDLPFGIIASLVVCTVLYVGVAIVLLGMLKYTTFVSGEAAEAPVAYALKVLGAHPFYRTVIVVGALMGMISSLLVFQYGQARIWYAMSRDGLLPEVVFGGPSPFQDAALVHLDCVLRRGHSGRDGGHRGRSRSLEHWHAVRLHAGVVGSDPAAAAAAGPAACFPSAIRAVVPTDLDRVVRRPDDGTHGDYLDPLRGLAGIGVADLLLLQSAPQRVRKSRRHSELAPEEF